MGVVGVRFSQLAKMWQKESETMSLGSDLRYITFGAKENEFDHVCNSKSVSSLGL